MALFGQRLAERHSGSRLDTDRPRTAQPRPSSGAAEHAHVLDASGMDTLVLSEMIDATKAFERAAQRLASALDGSLGKTTPSSPLIAASLRIATAGVIAQATG